MFVESRFYQSEDKATIYINYLYYDKIVSYIK